ncbi:MAG: DUF11 domain-containing protein, partial [Propionibacteriaceae bacterium]|nr:DUF11 domain-containing protein [Propionibacteriaceae bacterium]
FLVTNTGKLTVSGVEVLDSLIPDVSCPDTDLGPGDTLTCTGVYALTQDDIDLGRVDNTATATAVGSDGVRVSSQPSSVTVLLTRQATVSLVKTADKAEVVLGDVVTYTFLVTNTGNVTISDILVSETAFSGTGVAPVPVCPHDSLGANESMECTATYTVTQQDVDAGRIDNAAVVTGNSPTGDEPQGEDGTEVGVPQEPGISIDKVGVLDAGAHNPVSVGDKVFYTFTVTNTGNVTLHDVVVTDAKIPGVDCGTISTIDPNDPPLVCHGTYSLTQADIDAGHVVNVAIAKGTTPKGDDETDDSPPSDIVIPSSASLHLVKSADADTVVLGETVTYTFDVTNTGNLTMSGTQITERAFSGSGEISQVECPQGDFVPGETVTCTATYVVTQTDVDAGSLRNVAYATATTPSDLTVDSNDAEATVAGNPNAAALSLTKSGTVSPDAHTPLRAGDALVYAFRVTNTGPVTIRQIAVTDPMITDVTCTATTLAPAAEATCQGTYALTQGDIDAGVVVNHATATGVDPNDDPVTTDASNTMDLRDYQKPSLSLVKTVDKTTASLGDTVTFSYLVTNTGNVTMKDISIEETDFTGFGSLDSQPCPTSTLLPGEHMICTATYVVLQRDVDTGLITNAAIAKGTDPEDVITPSEEEESPPVTIPQTPEVTLVKSVDQSEVQVGDELVYTFTLTNTGNITLTDVAVNETLFTGQGVALDLSMMTCQMGGQAVDLTDVVFMPGKVIVCTLPSYTTVDDDVDAVTNTGTVSNTAVVTAVPEVEAATLLPIEDPFGNVTVVTSNESTVDTTVSRPAGEVVPPEPTPEPPLAPAPEAKITTGGTVESGTLGAAGLLAGLLVLAGVAVFAIGSRRRRGN